MVESKAHDLAVGDVVCGKFRVERIIGEGGMGLVVAATHLGLDEPVALKLLHPDARKSPEALARFFQEAKAAAKLKSEHVARVLDVSQRPDGAPFIVMEFLRGSDLRYVLGVDGPLSVEKVADYVIQACEGLAEAHGAGIIHRDIKPENLFLTERTQGFRAIKILDFGISKYGLDAASVSTSNLRTGAIMGSPSYMSPEQLRETSSVDHRTDIWALGAVMYELLTGHAAFDSARPLTALILDIMQTDPRPVSELRPHVPAELSAIVARCLSKNREDRFATAADLAIALLPFAHKRSRVVAERAVAITNERGLAPSALMMPVTAPPASFVTPVGLAKTALALDFELPRISSNHIATHPDLIAEMGRTARTRSWAQVAVAGIFALAAVTVVAILGWPQPLRVVTISRARAHVNHVEASPREARNESDFADPVAPHVATPAPPARPVVVDVPPTIDPALEIRGSR